MQNESTNNDQKTTRTGPEFWLSLDQYRGDAEFAKRAESEFMSSPLANEDGKDGVARREFLKLMGASIAMATTACVRRPVQHIIPYAQAPKEVIPGIPNFYTSTWFDGYEGYGLLVKTLEGRPVKLEGNPEHPMNLGSLPARTHAEILNLYDPDRLTHPVRNLLNKERTNRETISAKWEDLDPVVVEQLQKGDVAILSTSLPSPSGRAIISDFSRSFGQARWVTYDTLPADPVREAQNRCYGQPVLPRYRLDLAKMIVSVDADLLGTYIAPAAFMKQWSRFRKPGPEMGRMVMFESTVSLTGLNADDRYRIKPSQQIDVVLGLANAVVKASGGAAAVPGGAGVLRGYEDVAARLGLKAEEFNKIARQLWETRGRSLIVAGGLPTYTAEAIELQIAVNLLNTILGNDGQTIDTDRAPFETLSGSSAALVSLIDEMKAGRVRTLIVHNINPVYALPPEMGFLEAMRKVEMVIYTGNRNDETGKFAHYVLPHGTTLESWGDYELQSGLVSVQQPTIRPLHDTRAFEESLLTWTRTVGGPPRAKAAADWYEYVRAVWRTEIYPRAGGSRSYDDFWLTVLQQGVVDLDRDRTRTNASRAFSADVLKFKDRKPRTGYELVLYPTPQIADGTYANVAWLQELPDPVTKIVWDNYVMISLSTARKENLSEGDLVDVQVGERALRLPIHIQPGMHDEVLAIAVGYGRADGGKVARQVGANAYHLAGFVNGQPVYSGLAVTMKKAGGNYRLVSTQDHHVMEGRQIVVETTHQAFQNDPGAGIHRHQVFSIWPEHQYTKRKWGMAIDLNVCTGCSACVIACQTENNVPVVGKKYVMEGREMHWLRIDRYYKGTPEAPEAVFQPMLCQHCETAPCETVCPVIATVHNEEGLNDMVYNRCVGTRYCSNNCPYKVRRFNWFNYAKREAPMHMALNPDVTVRARGVMEKCTFCVHRIRAATTVGQQPASGVSGRPLQTACQQTCPTEAIVFGDLNDKESAVYKLFQEKRTYALLEELNTQPRVRYMTRIRNADRAAVDHHAPTDGHGDDDDGKDPGANHDSGHGQLRNPEREQKVQKKDSQNELHNKGEHA